MKKIKPSFRHKQSNPRCGVKITEENIREEVGYISGVEYPHCKHKALQILASSYVDKINPLYQDFSPLHFLGSRGYVQILSHPSVDKVLDSNGQTPLQLLVIWATEEKSSWSYAEELEEFRKKALPKIKDFLRKKYPWFPLGNRDLNSELITEILGCSFAERFILGL